MNKTWVQFPIALIAATLLVVWHHATMDAGSTDLAAYTPVVKLADFTENFVHVTVFLERDGQKKPLLRATFEPTDAGFHLYGKDLPEDGIKGLGVPTRLDLPPQRAIAPLGPLFSDVPAHDFKVDALGVHVPIYPDGRVTLRQLVSLETGQGGFTAQCSVSYLSCQTNGACRLPVKRKVLQFGIPKGAYP